MPLPEGGKTCWPPEHCEPINEQIATWAAWYSGDAAQLTAIYAGENNTGVAGGEFFASEQGGFKATARKIRDRVRRWFWGNSNPTGQPRNRLHVPLAGDIAAASADLLFSEPPAVTVDDKATQARLDVLLDDGAHATLLEAAEIAAGLGGVYLRVCWDPATVEDRPWIAAVHPDAAVPEWSFGKLTAVTFWRVIAKTRTKVVRHLERHEPGKVLHGVYEGDEDELGRPVPLTDYPETAGLADDRLENGNEIPTGIDGLAAVYVPNMRPNRVWRNTPQAAALGRSDYAGVEALMDSLDLAYSSWMRDVELGKARLIVPAEYLQSHGKGQGASVDLDREVYEAISGVLGADEGKMSIEQVQFDIRVDEHQRTIADLKTSIVGSAGYSAQTFGLDTEGNAVTATEVAAQNRRSLITRDRKIRYWRPELAAIVEALLGIDAELFNTPGVVAQRPMIEWADGVSKDPKALAETLDLLARADAASIDTRVRMLHPDWDDPKVAEEVARIRADSGGMTDPIDRMTGIVRNAGQPGENDPAAPPDEGQP